MQLAGCFSHLPLLPELGQEEHVGRLGPPGRVLGLFGASLLHPGRLLAAQSYPPDQHFSISIWSLGRPVDYTYGLGYVLHCQESISL